MGLDVLTDAERRLVLAAAAGDVWWPDGNRTLRAVVVRALATGELLPGSNAPVTVHAKGIRIDDAQIVGPFDLESTTTSVPLWFTNCDFDDPLDIRYAKLSLLCLRGCRVRGVNGHRASIDGPLLLSRSDKRAFHSAERIDLTGAHIGGELSFRGAEIGGAGPVALDANGATIGASLFLRGMRASGLIDLTRVTVHGNLHAQGATLDHPGNEKVVMIARGAKIGGDAFLRQGFSASGLIDFTRAEFMGGLLMDGALLDTPNGTALSLNQARIGAALGLSQEDAGGHAGGALRGHLDLRGLKVNELRDDGSMWPARGTGFLKIDGFQYERFGGRATILSGRRRIIWLKLQRKNDLGRDFKAQPWEQLINTLRKMGHVNASRHVAVAKEDALLRSGSLSWTQWLWSWVAGLITGYGYSPMRSVYASILMMLIGVVIFSSADRQGIMAPADTGVLLSQAYRDHQKIPADYPPFNPWRYSADAFVPVVDLHQETLWQPTRNANPNNRLALSGSSVSKWVLYARLQDRIDRWVTRDVAEAWLNIQIIFGWILTSLVIAGVSGLLRPSRP